MRKIDLLFGLGMAGIVAALSFFILQRPLWVDEVNTLLYVQHGWSDMVELTRHDFSPPLYYLALKAWAGLVGSSPAWILRLPSLLFGILTAVALFFFSKRWLPPATAYFATAAFLLSFSTSFFFFEIRMYSLLMLLATLSTAALFPLLFEKEAGKRKKRLLWAAFVATSLAGAYSHYAYWFLIGGQALGTLFILARGKRPLSWAAWLLSQATIVALFAPWWPVFLRRLYVTQIESGGYWTGLAGNGVNFILGRLSLAAFIAPFENNTAIILAAGALLVLALALPLVRPKKTTRSEGLMFLFLAALVPLALLWLTDIYLIRYACVAFPLVLVLTTGGLGLIGKKVLRLPALFLLLAIVAYSTASSVPKELSRKSRAWPVVAQTLEEREAVTSARAAIVVPGVLASRALGYHYQGSLPLLDAFPESLLEKDSWEFLDKTKRIGTPMIMGKEDLAGLNASLEGLKEAWLVEYDSAIVDPASRVQELLEERFQNKEELYFVGSSDSLRITVYSVGIS